MMDVCGNMQHLFMPSGGGVADMKVAQNMERKLNQLREMMLNNSLDSFLTRLVHSSFFINGKIIYMK